MQASTTRITAKALRATALATVGAAIAVGLAVPLSASSYRHRHVTPMGAVSETIYRPGCAHQNLGLIDDCDFLVETHDPECRGD